MDLFRLNHVEAFPPKMYSMYPNILPEFALLVFGNHTYYHVFSDKHKDTSAYTTREWYKWFYKYCSCEEVHVKHIKDNIIARLTDMPLAFVPVAIYHFDPLETIMHILDEFPQFGVELPSGHQTVLVKHHNKYLYYDPEQAEHVDKLNQLFPEVRVLGDNNIQTETNDALCLLHSIMFIELANAYTHELDDATILQRINKDSIKSHLPSIVKKLI